jgi:glycosyltransferase involved in cell wall biosynthesis
MKVLFVSPAGNLGGAERVLLGILSALRQQRPAPQLHLLTLSDGPLLAAARQLGVTAEVLPLPATLQCFGDNRPPGAGPLGRWAEWFAHACGGTTALAGTAAKLRRRLAQLQPDVVHSNGLKTHLLLALAKPRDLALMWHVHDFYGARPLARRLVPWLRHGVATAVAVSHAVGRDLHKLLPGVPVAVVPNGVDVTAFTAAPGDAVWLDRLAGWPVADRTVRIGLVATYAHWKGHRVFMEALARLRRCYPNLPFRGYIVGGPVYQSRGSQVTRGDLQALAHLYHIDSHLGFVGFQANPAPVYHALDVVVHASTQPEPFGLTVVEAMACGRAVVVSNAGGAAELFVNESTALGVQPGDVKELTTALARLSLDQPLRYRLGTAARQAAVARFSHDRFAAQVIDCFHRVLAAHPLRHTSN